MSLVGFELLEEVAEFGVLAPEALVERAEDAEFATGADAGRVGGEQGLDRRGVEIGSCCLGL